MALVALSIRLFVFPGTGPSGPTDAVVLLAGAPEARLPLAVQLAKDGPRVLVVSAADDEINTPARRLCSAGAQAQMTVYCFTPEAPQNTRAEARAIGHLVHQQGWSRITVVTSTYHVQRARLLIRRCTNAHVTVIDARPQMSALDWALEVVHEVVGLAAAAVSQSC